MEPRTSSLSRLIAALATPFRFGMVGLSGAGVDLACFSLLGRLLPMPLVRGLAIWLAMGWNFVLNRRLTFADARRDSALRQYLLFCAACGVGAVVNWATTVTLCTASSLFSAHPLVAAVIGIAGGTVLNYVASRYLVFRPKLPATGCPAMVSTGDQHPFEMPHAKEPASLAIPLAEGDAHVNAA